MDKLYWQSANNKFKKELQGTIIGIQEKHVALVDGNGPCGCVTCKPGLWNIWSELGSLHASHAL